jgi:hypothetical protein
MSKGNILVTGGWVIVHPGNCKRLQRRRFVTSRGDPGKRALSVGSRVLTVCT